MRPDHARLGSVRMVAADLDGTMLTSAGAISPRVRAALAAASRRAVRLAFVTGRPLAPTAVLLRDAGVRGSLAASNGAVVCDARGRVLHRRILDGARAQRALRDLGRVPGLVLGAVLEHELVLDRGFPADLAHEWRDQICAGSVATAVADGVVLKLLLAHATEPVDTLAPVVQAALGRDFAVTYSTRRFVEVSHPQANKGAAVAALAEAAGVPCSAVACIGDMPNDLPMLSYAGVAAAVRNAHPAVLAAADIVTAGNDEDGVAHLLEAIVAARGVAPCGPLADHAG
ncbi:HAD-IIB family hydrolase [Actinoplanes teichomyceticus]|uniref:Cof subfamily protein (Haloacid dehalogenase superfamily)/HAD superfamily hydrolase (TIGR01484 family) n=1 Tax=Actinoplanes teichomyceticus TaxID=1867 RepID=A0A561VIM2_ACTTI|nr:HAD-IIB family hydrolase [Actinoplanes teichomyceticus]TWG11465.1 hypothetical protein FHX34_106195 [Actinoplanes teichomyceticus]GIF15721.1 hydrolase [Actinoplanes teichomyceticus]